MQNICQSTQKHRQIIFLPIFTFFPSRPFRGFVIFQYRLAPGKIVYDLISITMSISLHQWILEMFWFCTFNAVMKAIVTPEFFQPIDDEKDIVHGVNVGILTVSEDTLDMIVSSQRMSWTWLWYWMRLWISKIFQMHCLDSFMLWTLIIPKSYDTPLSWGWWGELHCEDSRTKKAVRKHWNL